MYDPGPQLSDIRRASVNEALERDGYAVVRGAFSAEEIARMRCEVTALIGAEARTLSGGLINGPVSRESALARRLLNDGRLASHCGGELACQVHIHADTLSDWHVHLEPALTPLCNGASAWIYSIVIYLQNHLDRDGLSVVPRRSGQEYASHTPLHLGTQRWRHYHLRPPHPARWAAPQPHRAPHCRVRVRSVHTPSCRLCGPPTLVSTAPATSSSRHPSPERLAIFLLFHNAPRTGREGCSAHTRSPETAAHNGIEGALATGVITSLSGSDRMLHQALSCLLFRAVADDAVLSPFAGVLLYNWLD